MSKKWTAIQAGIEACKTEAEVRDFTAKQMTSYFCFTVSHETGKMLEVAGYDARFGRALGNRRLTLEINLPTGDAK